MTSTTVALCLLLVVTGALVLVCAALREVFRQLRDLREVTQLDDRPLPLTLSQAAQGEQALVGLPVEANRSPTAALVVLSETCATCLAIAESYGDEVIPNAWFTVADAAADAPSRVRRSLAPQRTHLIPGLAEQLRAQMGLEVVPAVLILNSGRLDRAYAISSVRQVGQVLPPVNLAAAPATHGVTALGVTHGPSSSDVGYGAP